jgi:hypothetical protein
MGSITHWVRLEPRPRSNQFGASLALPVRDPLWFLTRQWQLGDFEGTDAGSAAYIKYQGHASKIPRAVIGGQDRSLDDKPLESQTLAEPLEPDISLRVELGQNLLEALAAEIPDATAVRGIRDGFLAIDKYRVKDLPDDNELAPVDPATKRFLAVCVGRSLDGYELYQLGLRIAAGTDSVPTSVTTDPTELGHITAALASLVDRVARVFGNIETADPETWKPDRLEYEVQVVAVDPGGAGNAKLDAHPDAEGQYDWSSFDVAEKNTTASETAPDPVAFTMIPTNVRFSGMPNPRLWMFESNAISFADVQPNKRDVIKLLATDFMLLHGNDWYVIPYEQELGTLAKTDSLVVYDVFGHTTLVERADKSPTAPGTNRWTMFSIADVSGTTESLADYFLLPPSTGAATELGAVLEDVRFARDEMANMAWAIERVTESPIGEPRSGRERDAEIAAGQDLSPTPSTGTAPLRYQIESQVPGNWIPLLGVQNDPNNPSIMLEKGASLRPLKNQTVAAVPALGRILNPSAAPAPYQIFEEEVPRSGARLQRVVYRTRWHNGKTYLWVERRRQAGAGESQSNLRFDQALPNED